MRRSMLLLPIGAAIVAFVALWLLMPYCRGLRSGLDAGPVLLEFGRGSGRHGLATIRILEDGTVIINRDAAEEGTLEMAQVQMSANGMATVRDAISRHELGRLKKIYSHPTMQDGTQWVLRFKDTGGERSVYFNNEFPTQIVEFAEKLDDLLADELKDAKWLRVAYFDGRRHERELWESIKRN